MDDIIKCWGPIAGFLKVSEKTAVRYYKKRKFPVKYDKAGHPWITKKDIS